jgi:hypothetical protein
VTVLTSAAVYTSGNYDIILSTGSVNGINVRGYLVGSFSIKNRGPAATGVWAAASRTLTSGAVMWTAAGRLLSSGAAVWAAATRSLTDKAGFALTTGQHDSIATRAWAHTTRILTSGASVWAASPRTLTSGASVWSAASRRLSATGIDDVWNELASGHTTASSFGARLDTTVSSRATAAGVWAVGGRTLSSAAVVWTSATRGLTDKTGYALTTGQHDSIGTRAWATPARTLTSGGAVWTAAGRTLSSGASVWAAASKRLSATGITDIVDASPGELAALPAAAPGIRTMVQYIFQASRNTRITTATADTIHTSATAVVAKAPLSYVTGTQTFTRGKYV